MSALSFEEYLGIQQLYADYARAVDSADWDRWIDLFVDDCIYRIQPRENHERGFPLATLSFDSKGMLRDRAYGISETLFHDPYYQRHVVVAADHRIQRGPNPGRDRRHPRGPALQESAGGVRQRDDSELADLSDLSYLPLPA